MISAVFTNLSWHHNFRILCRARRSELAFLAVVDNEKIFFIIMRRMHSSRNHQSGCGYFHPIGFIVLNQFGFRGIFHCFVYLTIDDKKITI